ncbi:MAG: CDP-glucose 4,6-dehydratase [Coxiellaceae bacterium]|nr:CDP-glucose 4,6-dehydratase [Coxiellaceae bacterium]
MTMANGLFWKNRRVLITGHTGFKGSWLSLWLELMQANVCGIALEPVTNPNLFSLVNANVQTHIVDVRNFQKIHSIIHEFQPEIIIHMAAQPLVRYSYKNPIETYEINVMGAVHVLEAAKTCDSVKAIVNVTTDKCYENKEWIWGYREDEPMGGHDPYSNSKGCSELVTSAYRNSFYRQLNKGLASARAGNVIGGGDWSEDRLIADIMKSIVEQKPVIIRNPHAIRPWQHVLEPLSGYLLLAEKLFHEPKKYAEGWNFGPNADDVATVEDIVKKIFSQWMQPNAGWKIEQDSNALHEANYLKLDIAKATSLLQWKPRLTIDTTIQWICNWYQAWMNKESMREFTLNQIKQYENLGE